MEVSCSTGFDGGRVCLKGELDHHASLEAIAKTTGFIEEFKPGEVVIDMSGVGFMDSSGIAFLFSALKRVRLYGGKMRVTGLNAQCRRILTSAGIAGILNTEEEKYI